MIGQDELFAEGAVDEVGEADNGLVSQDSFELGKGLRSANFAQGALTANQTTVNLTMYDTPVRDQGQRGWCTAFATVAAMENLTKRHLGVEANLSEIDHFQSYRQYYMLSSMMTAAKTPITPETAWPYYGNPASNYQQQRIAKVASYVGPETRDEVLAELAAGYPVTIGLTTYPTFMKPAADGRIGMPSGQAGGGHAIAVTGFVRDASYAGGGYLILKNSWGTTWGINGYGKLPLDYCRVTPCYFLAVRSVQYGTRVTPASGNSLPTPTIPTDDSNTNAPADINDATVKTVIVKDATDRQLFRLTLAADPSVLNRIASVRYNVHSSFGSYQYSDAGTRASNFQSVTQYRSRYTNWRTTATEVTLTDGTKVVLAGGVVN